MLNCRSCTREETRLKWTTVALFLLVAFDTILTLFLVQRAGPEVEMNPLMAAALHISPVIFALFKMIPVSLVILLAVKANRQCWLAMCFWAYFLLYIGSVIVVNLR